MQQRTDMEHRMAGQCTQHQVDVHIVQEPELGLILEPGVHSVVDHDDIAVAVGVDVAAVADAEPKQQQEFQMLMSELHSKLHLVLN